MVINKLKITKRGTHYIYSCQFCEGDMHNDIEISEADNSIKIKGNCRHCNTYVFIETSKRNIIIL